MNRGQQRTRKLAVGTIIFMAVVVLILLFADLFTHQHSGDHHGEHHGIRIDTQVTETLL